MRETMWSSGYQCRSWQQLFHGQPLISTRKLQLSIKWTTLWRPLNGPLIIWSRRTLNPTSFGLKSGMAPPITSVGSALRIWPLPGPLSRSMSPTLAPTLLAKRPLLWLRLPSLSSLTTLLIPISCWFMLKRLDNFSQPKKKKKQTN